MILSEFHTHGLGFMHSVRFMRSELCSEKHHVFKILPGELQYYFYRL